MRDLTQGNIHKSFLLYSIPVVITSVLNSAFGILDTSIAGHFLGAKALAALNSTGTYFALLQAVFWGINMGLSTYVARMFAAKEYRALKRILTTNLLVIVGFVSLLAIPSLIFQNQILSFLRVDPAIWTDARNYYVVFCFWMIIQTAYHLLSVSINAMGNTTFPLFLSILSAVLNLGGNILSVTVWKLGVLGIGLSTLFSTLVCLICYLVRFQVYFKKMGVAQIRFRPRWIHFTALLSYTLPNSFQQLSMYLASFLITPLRNGLGYTVVAASTVTNHISSMCTQVYYASSRAGGNYISQSIGAKKFHKIRPAVGVAMLQGTLFFLPLMICVMLFPEFICNFFLETGSEPEVLKYSVIFIHYFLPFHLLNLVCAVFHSALRGVKSVRHLFAGSMISSFTALAASYLLIDRFGIIGLYAAGPIGNAVECVYVLTLYFTGLWLPKNLRPLVHKSKKSKKTAE